MIMPDWLWIAYAAITPISLFAFRSYLWKISGAALDWAHQKKVFVFLISEVVGAAISALTFCGLLRGGESLDSIIAMSVAVAIQFVRACAAIWIALEYSPPKKELIATRQAAAEVEDYAAV